MRLRILGHKDDNVLLDFQFDYRYQMFIKLEEFVNATLADNPFCEVLTFRFQLVREVADSEIAFDFTPKEIKL